MKRTLKIALAVAASCFLALAAQAATDSENIVITATVGDILDVQMVDDSGAGLAETLGYIGTIRILSNDPTGFSFTVSSADSGVLTRAGGTETIDYYFYLIYQAGTLGPDLPGNFPLDVAGQTQLTAPLVMDFDTNVSATDVTYSLNVELGNFVGLPTGDYSDTLTFDIADSN